LMYVCKISRGAAGYPIVRRIATDVNVCDWRWWDWLIAWCFTVNRCPDGRISLDRMRYWIGKKMLPGRGLVICNKCSSERNGPTQFRNNLWRAIINLKRNEIPKSRRSLGIKNILPCVWKLGSGVDS